MWEPANRVWEPGTGVWAPARRVWELKRDVWELSSHQLPLNLTPGPDTDAQKIFNKTNDVFLYQNVNHWTRCRPGQQPNHLDYVFTDEDNLIEDIKYTAPLGRSDHICIELNYVWIQPDCEDSCSKYNYWKGDYSKVKDKLRAIDWDKELNTENMEGAWAYFRDTISVLTQTYVPYKQANMQ